MRQQETSAEWKSRGVTNTRPPDHVNWFARERRVRNVYRDLDCINVGPGVALARWLGRIEGAKLRRKSVGTGLRTRLENKLQKTDEFGGRGRRIDGFPFPRITLTDTMLRSP
jgi:hypothetical protein